MQNPRGYRRSRQFSISAAILIAALVSSGCSNPVDPRIEEFRSVLLAASEPAGAIAIEDARQKFLPPADSDRVEGASEEENTAQGDDPVGQPDNIPEEVAEVEVGEEIPKRQNVVLITRVGNSDIDRDWWDENQATLVVSEGFPESHYSAGPEHRDDCPFCKARWKNEDSMAFVRFVDAKGKTFPVDARKLLNVKADDFIVISGIGQLDDEKKFLQVDVDSVYVRGAATN